MIRFIDLFAGIGGMRLAFEWSQAQCVWGSEIDTHAQKTYFINFGDRLRGDIRKISSSEIPDFDILCAGFPCQSFSVGGLKKGFDDERGALFFEIERILKDKQPRAFCLENVRGLVDHDAGQSLKTIKETLGNCGYVFEDKTLNAKDYGFPHNRERWFCIGFRKDLDVTFDCMNALKGGVLEDKTFYFPLVQKKNIPLKALLEDSPQGYSISDKARLYLHQHLERKKIKLSVDSVTIVREIRRFKCSFRQDGLMPCLGSKMGTGGNNIPVIVEQERKLTERECLRLMGFPESFKIKRKSLESYKQIGNSVVVPLVYRLSQEIMRVLISFL